MNRFVMLAFALMFALAGAEIARAADAGVPASYKSEPDPSGHRAEITSVVAQQIVKLSNDADPAGQSAAREWLATEAALPNAQATSAGYLDLYSDILNKALEPLMENPATTARAKVNAALIAGRVADTSGTDRLVPTIMAALGDSNEAVVLLGEKAAGNVVPGVLKNVNGNMTAAQKAFLDTIVNAVSDHLAGVRSGAIAEAAYSALNPGLRANVTIPPAAAPGLADAMIKLQKIRLAVYTNSVPDSPDADASGSLFLMDKNQWAVLTTPQKVAAMQNASDLMWCAAQRASQLPANTSQDLIKTLNNIAQMIDSVAKFNLNNQDLDAALQPAIHLNPGALPQTILDACKDVITAIQAASPDFKSLRHGPELPAMSKK